MEKIQVAWKIASSSADGEFSLGCEEAVVCHHSVPFIIALQTFQTNDTGERRSSWWHGLRAEKACSQVRFSGVQ
jgi:hypothetical protein